MFYIDCVLKSFGKFYLCIYTSVVCFSRSGSFRGFALCKSHNEVLVALHLCKQSCSEGFGGSASLHTNQAVDFWWIYLFVGVTHRLQRV